MDYVLLVEDNPDNADIIIRLLQSENLTVKHCTRGLEGLQAAAEERPALVLLDFNLPDVDGRTLILSFKKRYKNSTPPPVIAVTARTGPGEEAIAKGFGCDAFVQKPFDPQTFVNLVQQFLQVGRSA